MTSPPPVLPFYGFYGPCYSALIVFPEPSRFIIPVSQTDQVQGLLWVPFSILLLLAFKVASQAVEEADL